MDITAIFDQIIDRNDSQAIKWKRFAGEDILPMWVADMDFEAPDCVKQALIDRVSQCDLGYTAAPEALNQATIDWLWQQHQWKVDASWIVWVPGIVPAFNIAAQAFCQESQQCIVQTPNYPPLLNVGKSASRNTTTVNTIQTDKRWMVDQEQLNQLVEDKNTDCLILCNPLNPHGSQLSLEDVKQTATLCKDNNVVLVSDEIHCDLRLSGKPHYPAAKIDPDNAISLMAASKTFNIAGLGCAFAVIPNPKLRKQFQKQSDGIMPWPSSLGYTATQAAFAHGQKWHQSLIKYLTKNRDQLAEFINQQTPFNAIKNDATFLLWVDGCGFSEDLYQWFIDAGIAPSPGKDFGDERFIRLNFGCPNSYIVEAIEKMKTALGNS